MPLPLKQVESNRLLENKISARVAMVGPSSYKADDHSFEVIATTEEPTYMPDYDRWEMVYEVLLMSGMRMPEGSPDQVPLLDTHDRWSVESVLGSARGWRTQDSRAICRTYLSSVEDAVEAETKIREGHITDVSIGYCVDQSVFVEEGTTAVVNGRTFTGPVKVVTQWTVKELSLVPIGADQFAKFRSVRAAQLGLPIDASDQMIRKAATNQTNPQSRKDTAMNEEQLKQLEEQIRQLAAQVTALAGGTSDAAKLAEAQRQAEDAAEIFATATRMSTVPGIAAMAQKAIDEKRSASAFMKDVLEVVAKNPAPVNPPEGRSVITLSDYVKPWQRRSVRYLNMVVAEKRNPEQGRALRTNYMKELGEITEAQRAEELRESAELIRRSGISEMQQHRLMSSLSAGAGANLVPTPMLAEIFILVEKWGVARRYFRPIPMTQDTLKLDSLATEATSYWVTQGASITSSDLSFGTGTLTARKLAVIGAWTNELNEDAAVALLPVIMESFARQIFKKEDLAGFIGDGTSTYGSFTGLLGFAGNVVTMDAGKTAFTDATADDYKALRDAVNIDFREGACFFLSPASVSSLEGLKDNQGRYIYREPANGLPAMLWGYPIADSVGINALTLTSAAATKFAAFGNPKNMLMGMRRDVEILASREGLIDASGTIVFNALAADGEILRVTERVGFQGMLASGFSVLKTAAA